MVPEVGPLFATLPLNRSVNCCGGTVSKGNRKTGSDDFQIRTLPRGSELKKPRAPEKKLPRLIIYVGTACVLLLGLMIFVPKSKPVARAPQTFAPQLGKFNAGLRDPVSRHMQDALILQESLARKSETENLELNTVEEGSDLSSQMVLSPSDSSAGVQLDSENSAEKVFEDLYDQNDQVSESTLADRFNAHLATRKWVNEFERRERMQFMSSFIRAVHEQGYELDIDQNLVVVGVRRRSETRKVNINQVLDRLAKQGI